jgi:membrane dipeptidase
MSAMVNSRLPRRPGRTCALLALVILIDLLAATSAGAVQTWEPSPATLARVRDILRRVPLIDGHNDFPWQARVAADSGGAELYIGRDTAALPEPLQTDLARLRTGMVGGQFWSVWVPTEPPEAQSVVTVLEQIDLVHRLIERHPQALALALTAEDIERIHASGRIACLIGVEGGHCIAGSLPVLRRLYAAGARYLTLTHNDNTEWADSATDEAAHEGLTPFGRQVIAELNRLGMLVDLSHTSVQTMSDGLDASLAPVIFSHSSCRALCPHVRNVPDDILRRLPDNGGLLMVTFVSPFVSPEVLAWTAEREAEKGRGQVRLPGQTRAIAEKMAAWLEANPPPQATIAQVADHIEHAIAVAGVSHVGIGSDFDGMGRPPLGLEDVSRFPWLLALLLERGYSEQDVAAIAGGNLLRVMRETAAVAARLQRGS